jgi:hypothetical protein
MKTKTVKTRLAKAEKFVDIWRTRLHIDPKWELTVVYDSERPKDSPQSLCIFDDSSAQYWQVTLRLLPELMELPREEFDAVLDRTILHELLHLITWQYSSCALNLAGKRAENELVKLEEQLVQALEDLLNDVKWPRVKK